MKIDSIKKAFQLYLEAINKVFDGLSQLIKRPKILKETIDNTGVRKAAPYVILAAAFINSLYMSSLPARKGRQKKKAEKKAEKVIAGASKTRKKRSSKQTKALEKAISRQSKSSARK